MSKKIKNDLLVRHSPNVEAYVSLRSKRGDRTEIKVQVPNEYVKLQRTPIHWKTIYKSKVMRLVTGIASSDSDYVVAGQRVFKLIFANGQSIRIDRGDLPERQIRKVNLAIIKELSGV